MAALQDSRLGVHGLQMKMMSVFTAAIMESLQVNHQGALSPGLRAQAPSVTSRPPGIYRRVFGSCWAKALLNGPLKLHLSVSFEIKEQCYITTRTSDAYQPLWTPESGQCGSLALSVQFVTVKSCAERQPAASCLSWMHHHPNKPCSQIYLGCPFFIPVNKSFLYFIQGSQHFKCWNAADHVAADSG